MFDGFLSQGPIFIVCLVFMLGIVVVIHELGHYLAGRYFGAGVESFSVGFGKPIFERSDSRGTRWRVNWIPLGGFVKFVGESQLPGDVGKIEQGPVGKPFHEIGVWPRTAIAAAGPVANFILAALIFAVFFYFNGAYQARVGVTSVVEGGAAAEAGIETGDIFVSMGGEAVDNAGALQTIVSMSSNKELLTIVERNGEKIELTVTPQRQMRENAVGQVQALGTIGITLQELRDTAQRIHYNPVESLAMGGVQTWDTVAKTTDMIGRMITGKEALSSLSGPVAIGDISRRVVNRTMANSEVPLTTRINALFWSMMTICAAVSVGIGFFNLLPLPVLDGGHIVFNCYEAFAGKPLPARIQEGALMAGMFLLLGMFVFITWGDVLETGLFNGARG
ncbi:M50 family metallopeptidase [Henriciella marina]|uniref:RIP metalloprotease n=1 Tax=Henriciella marina TaxID=453851 RepID=A0ABT4LXH0_9PROT|nr:RIP metalloprotease [Henriciella marina]MCZ4299080.1 RIP metalloprotease [Henriciella marina]